MAEIANANFDAQILNFGSLLKMKFIPQVMLVYSKNKMANVNTSKILIKTIVCQKVIDHQICATKNLCSNCAKIANDNYFDFKKYYFHKNEIMTKNIAAAIINDLVKSPIENNAIKIYLINQIENSSNAANSMLLQVLENVPKHTYLIFTTTNINKILPTIKSRCQLLLAWQADLTLNNNDEKQLTFKIFAERNLENDQNKANKMQIILKLIAEFIFNENNHKINHHLLVKTIINLKEDVTYFFKTLNLVIFNKLYFLLFKEFHFHNALIERLAHDLKVNNHQYLAFILVEIQLIRSKLNLALNLNLLVNAFFIKINGV